MATSLSNLTSFLLFFFLLLALPMLIYSSAGREGNNSIVLRLVHSLSAIDNDNLTSTLSSSSQSAGQSNHSIPYTTLMEYTDGYLLPLRLGTPPQEVYAQMDTGSDLVWIPCGKLNFHCSSCYRYTKVSVFYTPSKSSSLTRAICSSVLCSKIHSSDNPYDACAAARCRLGDILNKNCSFPCPSFAHNYGGGDEDETLVKGFLTVDTLRVPSSSSSISLTNLSFGCVTESYGISIGVAGFGRGPLSLPSQLGFLNKGFSHCFLPFKYANNPNFSSPLVLGELAVNPTTNSSPIKFTPLLKSATFPSHYLIGLESITLNNGTFTLKAPENLSKLDPEGNGGMLIDSGTTYTKLPQQLYIDFLSAIDRIAAAKYPRAKDVEERTGFDLCYRIPCPNHDAVLAEAPDFPSIAFRFLNNVVVDLPQLSYLYAVGPPQNQTVAKCLLIQEMEEGSGGYAESGLFGSFQQQDMDVVYDLQKERIGFRPMDCTAAAASYRLIN